MKSTIFLIALLFFFSLPLGSLDAKRRTSGIKRSSTARHQFMKLSPCPSTGKTRGACPGYVVDHIVPLKRGGADSKENMQWQTKEDAKQKDKWE